MEFYTRKPNTVGGGSKTNKNGLSFEGRTSLIDSLNQHPDIFIKDEVNIIYKEKNIGYYSEKHQFYSKFVEPQLRPKSIDWRNLISKKYLPDSVIVNKQNQTVYVVEKKYQAGSGSVDEKLQTCDFKKKIYNKLIQPTGFNTEYYYLLNDWYDQDQYNDVKQYIESVGCRYFINEIPLEEFGIS